MAADPEQLKKWILSNMITDSVSELDVYKEEVAKLLTLTQTGTVLLKVERGRLDMPMEILLQLIGRAYAAAAGMVESDEISNNEFVSLVKGSAGGQRWALTKLRGERLITATERGTHRITPSQIGLGLEYIKSKLKARPGG